MTDKIEVPCSGCSTDPCYHWPYCTELLSLRAQVERLNTELSRMEDADVHGNLRAVELEDEVERQHREIATWGQMWDDVDLLAARVEALRNGTAILGSTSI
jgi:hypothetical protein